MQLLIYSLLVPRKRHSRLSISRIHWIYVQQSLPSLLGRPRDCHVSWFEGEGHRQNRLGSSKSCCWTVLEENTTRQGCRKGRINDLFFDKIVIIVIV